MASSAEQVSAGLLARIAECRTAVLPGPRIPLLIGEAPVGYVGAALAADMADYARPHPGGLSIPPEDAARLNDIATPLGPAHGFRTRGELFDVRARIDGPVLATLDRGALPAFGVIGVGVHLNGYVQRADGPHLWIGRRSPTKKLDPGKLDNLVGGGVSAGMGAFDTLAKEAAEEASIPPDVIARARPVARIAYDMERPEGLRRDLLVCYDLELDPDFRPEAADGEVESFTLIPAREMIGIIAGTDEVKFNVNLVLIEFLLRHGVLGDPHGRLRAALAAHSPSAGD